MLIICRELSKMINGTDTSRLEASDTNQRTELVFEMVQKNTDNQLSADQKWFCKPVGSLLFLRSLQHYFASFPVPAKLLRPASPPPTPVQAGPVQSRITASAAWQCRIYSFTGCFRKLYKVCQRLLNSTKQCNLRPASSSSMSWRFYRLQKSKVSDTCEGVLRA